MGTPLLFSEVMDEQGNGAGKGDRLQHGNSAGHPADTEDEGQHGEDSGDEVEKGHGGSFRGFKQVWELARRPQGAPSEGRSLRRSRRAAFGGGPAGVFCGGQEL